MTTVLEQYAEYLRDHPDLMVTQEDNAVWREFLKLKYGIPYEENDNGEGQEEELQEGSCLGGAARADRPKSRS